MLILFVTALVPAIFAADNGCLTARDSGDTSCGATGGSKFYFDKTTKRCQPFYYKGCKGNANKFDSRADCMKMCADVKEADAPHTEAVCESGAFAAGATSGQPFSCSSCPKGYTCEKEQCCPTKEFVCSLQYDAGSFGSSGHHTPRFFHSKSYGNCMLFTFYGRDGNANNFATYNECKKFCMDK